MSNQRRRGERPPDIPWLVEQVDQATVDRLAALDRPVRMPYRGGRYLAKVVAWDFELSDDDPIVVLELGARADIQDLNGRTPLDLAIEMNHTRAVEVLSH